MASEIYTRHVATGSTLYATIRNTARQMWNTAGTPKFETLAVANWADYDIALTESPASSYFYTGTFPAISGNMVAGWYWVEIFLRAGGSPAIGDTMVDSLFGYWDGTTFKWWGDDALAISGDVLAADNLELQFDGTGYAGGTIKQKVDLDTVKTRAVGDVGEGNTFHGLQSADTGDTTVLRKGAGTHTGKTVEDKVDGIATILSGITSLAKWLRGLFRKDAMDATAKSEVNTDDGGFNETTDSLEAIRDRGDAAWVAGGDTGSGARTVTITVNDGSNPLQNAKVRVTQGAESYVATTNASGIVTFHLDDATWTVVITKPLYTYAGTTIVVNGDETATYSMTAVSIPASDPGQVTGFKYCYDENGDAEEGVVITLKQTLVAEATGVAYDGAERTATSGADGLVTFTGLFAGGTYRHRRGSGAWVTTSISSEATGSVELTSQVASD